MAELQKNKSWKDKKHILDSNKDKKHILDSTTDNAAIDNWSEYIFCYPVWVDTQ